LFSWAGIAAAFCAPRSACLAGFALAPSAHASADWVSGARVIAGLQIMFKHAAQTIMGERLCTFIALTTSCLATTTAFQSLKMACQPTEMGHWLAIG
jgi:hypothetical protein